MNRIHIALLAATAFTLSGFARLCPAGEGAAETKTKAVLCTTFPIYQITRNVAKDCAGVEVQLMLPSQLGCPHDYALTPQDMQKLAQADALIVNGLGMEEFLGAPVKKANPNLVLIDSSSGINDTLQYTAEPHEHGEAHVHAEGEHPFEWAGAFALEAGTYTWTCAKNDGKYAEPTMKLVVLPAATEGAEAIEATEAQAVKLFADEAAPAAAGTELQPGALRVLQFDAAQDATSFKVTIATKGVYVAFTEHQPSEFEAGEHFFKDAAGQNVVPTATEPAAGGGHRHHHSGVNPHLFPSPLMSAKLAANIAGELAKLDPAEGKTFAANAEAYAESMTKLGGDFAALGKSLKNNRIVTQHGAFDYLARDAGLEIVAVVQAHAGQEPGAAELLGIVKTIKEKQAGAIFTEPQYPEKIGQTISRETGIPTATLDPTSTGPENAPLDYYETVMRKNLKTLEETLGVR